MKHRAWMNVALVLAVLGSAFALVRTSYEAQRLFAEREKAAAEQRRLDAEFRRLETERQTAATSQRVDHNARQRLGMVQPKVREIEWVADPMGVADKALASAGLPMAASGARR